MEYVSPDILADPPPSRRSTGRLTLQTGKDNKESKGLSLSLTPSATPPPTTALDPLSTQIFLRTNTGAESLAHRLRSSGRPESPAPDGLAGQNSESPTKSGLADLPKERRKGTSFFSRLAMRSSFNKRHDDFDESDSEIGDLRTDGSSLPATTSVISDGGGYIPLHKEPPRYIRVKPYNTKHRNFHRLFLAQELLGSKPPKEDEQPQGRMPATAVGTKLLKAGDAIWAAEFSVDGRYLAVAGKDQVVRVFAVISTEEERRQEEEEEDAEKDCAGKRKERLSAPVFRSKPIREFKAHTGEVLSLCWSKNNFLLSSSMDKTVRLWHTSREECLATFKHTDLVTSIAFHPKDDRFFLAGSLDAQLRLWSIPDKVVAYSAPTNEFITAVAFSPDGKTAICGVLSGLCWFFDTDGLKPQFQIHVRSSRGKNAKGSKITGIKTAMVPPDSEDGDVKVLISSNDSRVRIYSLKTRMLEVKFKGLENQSSQIHARFSDDGAYIISGSEDRRAYIWSTNTPEAEVKDRQPYETFDAHPEVVTTALMAPTRTKQLLSASGDPVFDLCNPPPVLLRSLDEAATSQTTLSETAQTEVHASSVRKPEESPGYIKRCHHPDGNIIVTTDRTGTIKVFRQDCAFKKRQQNQWEMSSKFSKVNGLGRSGSIITRASGGTSRRPSLNLSPAQCQHPTDRIMSWRQDVDEGRACALGTPLRNDRSASPRKIRSPTPIQVSSPTHASELRKQPAVTGSPVRVANPISPTSSVRTRASLTSNGPTQPPTPSFSLISAAESDEQIKGDGSFWNLSRWGGISRLRYSMNASSPTESTSTEIGASSRNGGGLKPPDKVAARKSVGVADLSRLKVADDANRRKSMGPTVALNPEVKQAVEVVQEKGERRTKRDLSPLKKRTDSGVGRLSAESEE
ncbi:putative WD repeat-containing protein C3H5.08c [Cladobotryum mycophilum]|uniref:WD repeat-containing protein C3H5.08c n=1 Tax=Cladobotryum mycophilum TaxID=491253 RepID=A0ABR0SRP2_9HYPO